MEQNTEKIIGKIIYNKLPIEWMRYNMFSTDDIFRNIPMLVFRLSKSNMNDRVKELEKCVEGFQGNISWKVFRDPLSRKGNYLLTIATMESIRKECYEKGTDYNEKECLGDTRYRLYCEQAILDIPLLAEHIDKNFM